MHALVTGGAGFIGSHVVDALLDSGAKVRVLDDFSTGNRENLLPETELFEGSITDESAVNAAVEGCEAVFHLAAVASVQKSIDEPVSTGRTNVEGTLILAKAAAKQNAKIVFSSSAAVYGNSEKLPVDEADLPDTLSPYAAQKLAGESYLRALHECLGLKCVSLRYFNVYGPRQDPQAEYAAAVPKFITNAIEGRTITIFGDGQQTRDFVYVKDVARANLLAYESDVVSGAPFNIARGKSISVLELAQTILDVGGSISKIEHLQPRSGEIRHSSSSIALAREKLTFVAQTSLETGLGETVEFWRSRIPV